MTRTFGFGGSRTVEGGPGAGGPGGGGRGGGGFGGGGGRGGGRAGGGGANDQRFSLEIYAQASNVLNRVNYGGFSGTIGSPFFGQPTSAQQPRRLMVGSSFRF